MTQPIAYSDYGSIEGTLTATNNGFTIIRDVDERAVPCNMLEQHPAATQAVGKRMSLAGLVHYQADGHPLAVDVEWVEVFGDPETLPTLEEVRAVLKAA